MSDFDILVIVRSNKIVNSTDTWRRAETRAHRFPNRTWTNLIVESIETVNNALAHGHYFFTDIKKEGVLLYDTGEFKLARPRKLNPQRTRGNARAHFKEWFTSAKEFYGTFEYALKKAQIQARRLSTPPSRGAVLRRDSVGLYELPAQATRFGEAQSHGRRLRSGLSDGLSAGHGRSRRSVSSS